ncbi:MAG TPA: hypothetical protein VGI03_13975 [Verrucomicrobiae bacterium]|jgi:hypothetical protein
MKTHALFGILTLLGTSALMADQTDVSTAAQALAGQSSYTWKSTVVVPPDSQFQPAPTDGKIANGVISVSTSFGGNDMKYFIKGTNAAVYSEDNGWQSLNEMTNQQGPGRFMGRMLRNFQTPAMQATNLLANAKPLTKDGDAYSADLTDDGAKALLTFRRGGQSTVSNAKGSVKFWVANGMLTKFESKVTGTVSYNGNDVDVNRDTTVVISDVGSTKIDVPDDAQKKLQ